jgi:hypothetical protein
MSSTKIKTNQTKVVLEDNEYKNIINQSLNNKDTKRESLNINTINKEHSNTKNKLKAKAKDKDKDKFTNQTPTTNRKRLVRRRLSKSNLVVNKSNTVSKETNTTRKSKINTNTNSNNKERERESKKNKLKETNTMTSKNDNHIHTSNTKLQKNTELNNTYSLDEENNENNSNKKEWNSWTKKEKLLFYKALSICATDYPSLKKLFSNMTEQIGTKSTHKIREYYYRAYKTVVSLLSTNTEDSEEEEGSSSDIEINLSNKKEILCALECFGTMVLKDKRNNSSSDMKKLIKRPTLYKQVAKRLKKLVSDKLSVLRKVKNKDWIYFLDKDSLDNTIPLDSTNQDENRLESRGNNNNFQIFFIFCLENTELNKYLSLSELIDQTKILMNKGQELILRKIPFLRFGIRLNSLNYDTYNKVLTIQKNPKLEYM